MFILYLFLTMCFRMLIKQIEVKNLKEMQSKGGFLKQEKFYSYYLFLDIFFYLLVILKFTYQVYLIKEDATKDLIYLIPIIMVTIWRLIFILNQGIYWSRKSPGISKNYFYR